MKIWNYNWGFTMEGGRIIHPDTPYMWYSKKCVGTNLANIGQVVLETVKDPVEITYYDHTVYNPTMACGVLRSTDAFSFGTFSAEIVMPQGKGLWPGFWLTGDGDWPETGEIDICEGYSDRHYFRLFTPYFPWINPSWKTTTNVHYADGEDHKMAGSRSIPLCKQKYSPDKNKIKYEVLWTPDEIVFKVDGKTVHRDTEAVKRFSKPGSKMHVIFDSWCEDPAKTEVQMDTPMIIKNFEYKPI